MLTNITHTHVTPSIAVITFSISALYMLIDVSGATDKPPDMPAIEMRAPADLVEDRFRPSHQS